MTTIPYTAVLRSGQWFAVLATSDANRGTGEELGPYPTLAELERDSASLNEHIERGCFSGAK